MLESRAIPRSSLQLTRRWRRRISRDFFDADHAIAGLASTPIHMGQLHVRIFRPSKFLRLASASCSAASRRALHMSTPARLEPTLPSTDRQIRIHT